METEALDFAEALELLADRYHVELEREEEDPRGRASGASRRDRLLALLERTAAFYVRAALGVERGRAARAPTSPTRGLEEDVLREFRVGFSPAAWDRVIAGVAARGLQRRGAARRRAGSARRERRGLIDRFRGRLMFPLADARGRVLGFGARALRDRRSSRST